MLSFLVWTPFAFGLLTRVVPRRLGRAAAFVGATAPVGLFFLPGEIVTRSWLPAAGASYELAIDGWSGALAAFVSLVALAALATCRDGDERAVASTLVAETALVGMLCSGDALLLLCFLGAAIASFSILSGSRRFAVVQWVGFSLVLGLFAFCYHEAWSQTGFPTSSLSRFRALVFFPELASSAFLAGAVGPLVMMLGAVAGTRRETSSGRSRPLFLAAYAVVPGFLLFRLVGSVLPSGASEHGALMSGLGLGLVLLAGLTPGLRIDLALQGIFLLGLFSGSTDGIVAAGLEGAHMVLALALWDLAHAARLRSAARLVVAGLVVLPPGGWLLVRALPSRLVWVVAFAWLVVAWRLARACTRTPTPTLDTSASGSGREASSLGTTGAAIALAPLLLGSALLYAAPNRYREHLEPTLAPMLPSAEVGVDESEEP